MVCTYKTKLKLDKEVGGGVLQNVGIANGRIPYWIHCNFWKFEELKIPFAKMVDLVPLDASSGPGAPDPDLARFHIKATPMEHRLNTPKSLKFLWFY